VRRPRATSGKPAKAQQTINAKREAASKAKRNQRLSASSQDTKVARLVRERDDLVEREVTHGPDNVLLSAASSAINRGTSMVQTRFVMAPNYRSLVPGGYFSSNPFDRTLPVSIRCNNPGAINGAPWEKNYPGYVDTVETTPGNKTTIFEAPEYGVAVWWELLRRYAADRVTTVGGIINRYGGGQDYSNYIRFVEQKTGFDEAHSIPLDDDATLLAFGKAMFQYEAGRSTPLKDDQIVFGFRLARADGDVAGIEPEREFLATDASPPVGVVLAAGAPAALVPSYLTVMRGLDGTRWKPGDGSNSTIQSWLSFISSAYPNMAAYCASVMHLDYFEWCGLTVAYCLAKSGIAPVFGTVDTAQFLWAAAWLNWGTAPVGTPQPGDIIVFEWPHGGHHVTLFEKDNGDGNWACHGGNQSHLVNIENFPRSAVIGVRRPTISAA